MQYEIRQCNRQNFCGCFCRMPGAYAKNSEKTARPKAECTAAAEKAVRGSPAKARRCAGKPRQSPPLCGEAPPKTAAARGSPAKARRRAGKPRQSPPPGGEAPPNPAAGRRTGRNIKKAAGRMTRRLRGLYSSACSKLTFLLLWLYNTVGMCRFCDETETLRLQLRTGLVKLLRCRFYLL